MGEGRSLREGSLLELVPYGKAARTGRGLTGAFPLTRGQAGTLTREGSSWAVTRRESALTGKSFYGKGGEELTRIGGEFPLVCRRPKIFLGLGRFWSLMGRSLLLELVPYGKAALTGRGLRAAVGRPAVVGRPCCGGETPLWWGDLAVVGRPRCGGETPLWWGDPAVVGRPWWGPYFGSKRADGPETAFPFKNGLFLVYSTIAEIRHKFDHFGPLWWGDPAVVGRPRCQEGPLRGRALTGKEGPEGQGCVHPLPRFRVI